MYSLVPITLASIELNPPRDPKAIPIITMAIILIPLSVANPLLLASNYQWLADSDEAQLVSSREFER